MANSYNDMRRRKNVFDRMIMPAIYSTGILYALQFTQVINLPLIVIVMPVLIATSIILLIMLFAGIIALIFSITND